MFERKLLVASPLAKARRNPNSMKAKILSSASKSFGSYGFHGATTRMIAKEAGVDISTLYYHWGEKQDLYEAVVTDLDEKIRHKLEQIEKIVKDQPLSTRFEIAIDRLCDFFFDRPEIPNLIQFCYFSKIRPDSNLRFKVPVYINNIAIAIAIGTSKSRDEISTKAKTRVLAAFNSIFNFVSAENMFRPMLGISRPEYRVIVKDTLKFILIPAFTSMPDLK